MKKLQILALLTLLTLMLTSCGNSGPSTKLNVTMTDFKYDSMNYSVPAGQEITMKIKNEGAVEHEFVIMKPGLTVGENFGPEDEDNIYWEVEVAPGETKTVTFTAPGDAGDYQVVCGTEGHFMAGMQSNLTVVK